MRWETKNRINNISQLNKTRQKNKELKNKPIEEIKEESIDDKYNDIIMYAEEVLGAKLLQHQKDLIRKLCYKDIDVNTTQIYGMHNCKTIYTLHYLVQEFIKKEVKNN